MRPCLFEHRYSAAQADITGFVFFTVKWSWAVFALLLYFQSWIGPSLLAADKAIPFSQAGKVKDWVKKGKIEIEDIPNPHWNLAACAACHKGKPGRKNIRLRGKGINATCNNCHQVLADHVHDHPLAVAVPKSMRKRMPPAFRKTLLRGKRAEKVMSCSSCHDIVMQCTEKRFSDRKINPKFMRGGPYRSRTGLCYKCHDKKAYQRLNSHDQISASGEIQPDKCLICHMRVPKQLDDGTAVDTELWVKTDYASLCLNCHEWSPHPGGNFLFLDKGGPQHLVKPPPGIRRHMLKMEKINGIILPLEKDNGQIYCATCHNPHARGVLKNPRAAKGADEPKRLRANPMCENCHDL